MFLSLFFVSFISATLWPLASEAVFVGFLHQNSDALLTLLIVAKIGNTLGSIVMYELARQAEHWLEAKIKRHKNELERWQVRLNRYGTPVLCLAWLPLVGDLLPVAGGLLKMDRKLSYFWLLIGKAGRYSILAAVAVGIV
jgi:membrane protein YqaA with SNARE-associated domain